MFKTIRYLTIILFIFLLLTCKLVFIKGFSMYPTISEQSMILSLKTHMLITRIPLKYIPIISRFVTPERGRIIVLKSTIIDADNNIIHKFLIKRILAVNGDIVKINKQGRIMINNHFLPQDKKYNVSLETNDKRSYSTFGRIHNEQWFRIKWNEFLCIGDNRYSVSKDLNLAAFNVSREEILFYPLINIKGVEEHFSNMILF